MTKLPCPCLMLVTEPSPRLPQIVAEAVAGGVDLVYWRSCAPDLSSRHGEIIRLAVGHPALLVVSNPSVVQATRANGLHLPEAEMTGPYRLTRRVNELYGSHWSLGDSLETAQMAQSG